MFKKQIKPVFNRRIHFTVKGLLRNIAIIVIHILSIIAYFLAIELVAYYQFDHQLIIYDYNYKIVLLMYLLLIGPFLNSVAHIFYHDKGYLSLKAFVWIHTWLLIILIPTLIFI